MTFRKAHYIQVPDSMISLMDSDSQYEFTHPVGDPLTTGLDSDDPKLQQNTFLDFTSPAGLSKQSIALYLEIDCSRGSNRMLTLPFSNEKKKSYRTPGKMEGLLPPASHPNDRPKGPLTTPSHN